MSARKFRGRRLSEREAQRLAELLWETGLKAGHWGKMDAEGPWERLEMLGGTWLLNGRESVGASERRSVKNRTK